MSTFQEAVEFWSHEAGKNVMKGLAVVAAAYLHSIMKDSIGRPYRVKKGRGQRKNRRDRAGRVFHAAELEATSWALGPVPKANTVGGILWRSWMKPQ